MAKTSGKGKMSPARRRASRAKVPAVQRLLACPFCRELFTPGEVTHCPSCGLAPTDLAKLPPSYEALDDENDGFGIPHDPRLEPLPMLSMAHGRGLLLLSCLLGLSVFFLPWVHMTAPELQTLTGADLAQRGGWVWSAAVAWFVLLPLVLTRRSIDKMRGARVAAASLSAIPAMTAAILMLFPPKSKLVPLAFGWGAGIYASFALGILATVASLRFGGRVDEASTPTGQDAPAEEPTLH